VLSLIRSIGMVTGFHIFRTGEIEVIHDLLADSPAQTQIRFHQLMNDKQEVIVIIRRIYYLNAQSAVLVHVPIPAGRIPHRRIWTGINVDE
jgi:hypothetical protein